MTTISEWYKRVNAAWPETIPPMTFEQGANAVRRLFRFVEGQTWEGKIVPTSGNRYNWTRRYEFRVNPGGNGHGHDRIPNGWKDLIHDLSHLFIYRGKMWEYKVKPHSRDHAMLELRLVREVVRRGWLNPETIPIPVRQLDLDPETEAPVPETIPVKRETVDWRARMIAEREARTVAALKRWKTKLKRAQTAIRKLSRRQRYYERKAG